MKSKLIITVFCSFIVIGAVLLTAGKTSGQEKKNNEAADVSKRLEALELLVKSQQSKIENLEKEIEKLKKNSPLATIPSLPNLKEMPKGAKPFEFNGRTYYMVPLNDLKNDKYQILKNK